MADPVVQKSQRFTRAARAERDRLARRRSQIFKKRQALQAKIDLLDQELEAVDGEIGTLESLAFPDGKPGGISLVEPAESDVSRLKGASIRTLAVPLLLREQGTAPIHYREWLALLTREGYAVAGKRPDAVFLNQVVRSPLVRATTQAGFYEVDLGAVEQLREKLRRRQAELVELIGDPPAEIGEAFDRHKDRRRELSTEIARTERELAEAVAAIKAWEGEQEPPAARAA